MSRKPLRFHPEATQEYLAALAWYRKRSLTAAINFESAVARAIGSIKKAPGRWPMYFDAFRKYTLHQFPFGVVYRETSNQIVVVAVAHASRNPNYWRSRV